MGILHWIKQNEKFDEMELEDVVNLLGAYDLNMKKKETNTDQVQDSGMYGTKGSPSGIVIAAILQRFSQVGRMFKELKEIDQDDLEEMDPQWKMTVIVKRVNMFIK